MSRLRDPSLSSVIYSSTFVSSLPCILIPLGVRAHKSPHKLWFTVAFAFVSCVRTSR